MRSKFAFHVAIAAVLTLVFNASLRAGDHPFPFKQITLDNGLKVV